MRCSLRRARARSLSGKRHEQRQRLVRLGGSKEVVIGAHAGPLLASYLERPKARPSGGHRPLRPSAPMPLVGRDLELSVVREALLGATAGGEGSVVVMTGEAGIGKTRLIEEVRTLYEAWVRAAPGRLPLWLDGRATSYSGRTPFGLYKNLLSAWLGVHPEEGEEPFSCALTRAMRALYVGDAGATHLDALLQMMGVGPGGKSRKGPACRSLGPEELKLELFDAMRSMISKLVSHGPTVLVLENFHWADPVSLQVTGHLLSLATEGPLLIMLTQRSEPGQGADVAGRRT